MQPEHPLSASQYQFIFFPCHWSLGFVLAHQMCWLLGCDSAPSIHGCSVPEHLFEQFWILPYDTASICVFPMYRKQRGRKTQREKIVGVASSPQICYWHLFTVVFPLKIPDINKKAMENPLTVDLRRSCSPEASQWLWSRLPHAWVRNLKLKSLNISIFQIHLNTSKYKILTNIRKSYICVCVCVSVCIRKYVCMRAKTLESRSWTDAFTAWHGLTMTELMCCSTLNNEFPATSHVSPAVAEETTQLALCRQGYHTAISKYIQTNGTIGLSPNRVVVPEPTSASADETCISCTEKSDKSCNLQDTTSWFHAISRPTPCSSFRSYSHTSATTFACALVCILTFQLQIVRCSWVQ